MNILVMANNDSDNLMIANVLFELQNRGHNLKIFSHHTDEKSIRMFRGLSIGISRMNELTDADIEWADSILSALRAHINLSALGEKVFCSKYIFMYNNYVVSHWMTAGGDFMFNFGASRQPLHMEDCASMPIGSLKNDYVSPTESGNSQKTILYIDSGHYPFSHKGKLQVANMLIDICNAFPDYQLVVKPRFLPTDKNMLHSNAEHLYPLLEKCCDGALPENLVLLQEHRDLQEMLDQCSCAILLASSAYVDAALRGKNILIVRGIDNEDKWELRNDIEFKNVYELQAKSGCVVDYKEVLKYLPQGLKCREEHLNELVAYRTGASSKMVDVMECIYQNFLKEGKFPAIKRYSYETYQQEMFADPLINWDVIKQKRLKNIGNDNMNSFLSSIVAPIDYAPIYSAIDNTYVNYPATLKGAREFLKKLYQIRCDIWMAHADLLMCDPLDQAEFIRMLYITKRYDVILDMNPEKILCVGPYNYYLGMICCERKDWVNAIPNLICFIKEAGQRSFAKYCCEEVYGIKNAYEKLFFVYDGINIQPNDFADIFIQLHEQRNEERIDFRLMKRVCSFLPAIAQSLQKDEPHKALKCLLLYAQYTRRYDIEPLGKHVGALEFELNRVYHSKTFRIGNVIVWIPRKIKDAILDIVEHGWMCACKHIVSEIQSFLKKLVALRQKKEPFRIWNVFHKKVLCGYQLYKDFVLKYGENARLMLSGPAAGDAYVMGTFFEIYCHNNYPDFIPVFGVFKSSSAAVAHLFGIHRTISYDWGEFYNLWNLTMFISPSLVHLESMHYHVFYRHTMICAYLEGLHGWNYFSLMEDLYAPTANGNLPLPRFDYDEDFLREVFEKNELVEGKTVLLAPYAKSLKVMPMIFWRRLAKRLKQAGLCVCTNSAGAQEPPIEGTWSISIPFQYSVPFLEKAGVIIALRSGLTDIINTANCLKVTLYPKNNYKRSDVCHINDSFWMSSMYDQPDLYDFVYQVENETELLDCIVELVISKIEKS